MSVTFALGMTLISIYTNSSDPNVVTAILGVIYAGFGMFENYRNKE